MFIAGTESSGMGAIRARPQPGSHDQVAVLAGCRRPQEREHIGDAGHLSSSFNWALPYGLQQEMLDMRERLGIGLEKAVPLRAITLPRTSQSCSTICACCCRSMAFLVVNCVRYSRFQ
uniref:Uncharacterized protein n=1 Tax=Nymphaea colorata TaxID=210225 RepID=A0A5K0VAH7_9MAGN